MASFGMTYLSPDAMRVARQYMDSDQQGVRDEIGFLSVHQRYADRFFPGTSVLHTRIRYVLFVPWMYHDEHIRPDPKRRTEESLKHREWVLCGRLPRGADYGIIGSTNYPRPVEQRPSQVYWGALARWGIVRELPGTGQMARSEVERLIAAKRTTMLSDDDGTPLSPAEWPFICPKPPKDWMDGGKLTFKLRNSEKTFLAKRLRSLTSPDNPGEFSLLARLVGRDLQGVRAPWSPDPLALAGEERAALLRAGQAAALSAIGRAIYAAQVETLREKHDGTPTSDKQRQALDGVVTRFRKQASALTWEKFQCDVPDLPSAVSEALNGTLGWVRAGRADPMMLEDIYRSAEESRKKKRARLSLNGLGAELRTDWENERHPPATPLHYRWDRVKWLLSDLVGA